MIANDYDSFAEVYSDGNETSIENAYYERPAMLELAGDVTGRRILDAGCGAGPLLVALRDRGAVMTGIDLSAGMLELTRKRLAAGDHQQGTASTCGSLTSPACCHSRTTRSTT